MKIEATKKQTARSHPLWKRFVEAFQTLSGFTPHHRDIVAVHNFDFFKAGAAQCSWSPIAGAPKDGSHVLLFSKEQGQHEAFWSPIWERWLSLDDGKSVYGTMLNPTHFRPLLELPTE